MTQLQIIDDKKQITGKKSIITACNVDYRLKRSGPKVHICMYLSVFLCLSGYVHLLVRENTFIILMYHMHNTDNLHCSNSIVVAFSTIQ